MSTYGADALEITLYSSSEAALVVPPTRLCTVGDRAFPVSAAPVWNGLPSHRHRRYTISKGIWRQS